MVQIASAVEDFLADKGKGADSASGTYHRDARRELDRFQGFLDAQSPAPTTMDELTTQHMRSYARHLSRQGWQANTTQTYYNLVSAFVGWAVREGYLYEHLATRRRAKEPLATDETEEPTRQQACSPAERSALTEYVDDRAAKAVEAVKEDRERAIKATRDRAIVYLLAYSGVRGAEVFRHRNDTRRTGLRWRHVSIEENYLRVLAKKQEWDDRALPDMVVPALERIEQALQPPGEDWPVFPSLHGPTLSDRFTTTLLDRGYSESEIETIRITEHPNRSLIELCVEYDVEPPSITTDAARYILKGLCADAGIDPGDGADYLKPHGARRGAGEAMVRAFGYAAAARALDNSETIVREHYAHIEAGELADQLSAAFEATDEERTE